MRYRKIMKYGNTDIIRLKPNDIEDLEWDYNDEVDIEDCVKVSKNE